MASELHKILINLKILNQQYFITIKIVFKTDTIYHTIILLLLLLSGPS